MSTKKQRTDLADAKTRLREAVRCRNAAIENVADASRASDDPEVVAKLQTERLAALSAAEREVIAAATDARALADEVRASLRDASSLRLTDRELSRAASLKVFVDEEVSGIASVGDLDRILRSAEAGDDRATAYVTARAIQRRISAGLPAGEDIDGIDLPRIARRADALIAGMRAPVGEELDRTAQALRDSADDHRRMTNDARLRRGADRNPFASATPMVRVDDAPTYDPTGYHED